jgi:hypothetical protein
MRPHPPLPHLLRLVGGLAAVVAFAFVLTVLIVFGLGAGVVR